MGTGFSRSLRVAVVGSLLGGALTTSVLVAASPASAAAVVVQTIHVGSPPLSVSSDGTHVWVATCCLGAVGIPFVGQLDELNASNGSVTSNVFGALGCICAVSSDGTHVWVYGEEYGVTELNASDGSFVQNIDGVGGPISSDGTHVWVADLNDTVSELNASTGSVVDTIGVGSGPSGISSDGAHVWVANSADNTVSELNASTGSVVDTIGVGSGPSSISSDGAHVWVANSGDNTVSEIAVIQASQTITFGPLANKPFGSAPFNVLATSSSGLVVSFASGTPSVCSVSGSTVTLDQPGTCSITASQAGDADYLAATPVTQSFTVIRSSAITTKVLLPSKGATLTGSTYLDASASNATSVEFRLFGGVYGYNAPVACTATPTIYGWLCGWNTTTVPNGTYTLVSLAKGSGGTAASSGVSITVINPPTTSVLIPSNGATLSGGTYLDASASNATSLEFRLFGGVYGYNAPVACKATPTIYGWLCSWNTTTVPNGSYSLVSLASNSVGTAASSGVSVTVANPGLADLASSSVTGTSSALTSCSFAGVTFNAAYPGSSAVGTVTLRMNGCIPNTGPNFPFTFDYSGTFTVTTGVGTLSGSVGGPIFNVNVSPPPDQNLEPASATLTLTATSGTGDFMGTTGTLHVSLQWPEPGSSATFIGTVTPA